MARILIMALEFWPSIGGVQTLTYNLAKRLVERGHEVTVFACHSTGTSEERIDGIRVRRFRRITSFRYRPWYIAPEMVLQNYSDFDIVHAFGLSFFHSLLASVTKKATPARFVLSALANPPSPLYDPWTSRYLRNIGRLILAAADLVVVQCTPELEGLSNYAESTKLVQIPCGVYNRLDREGNKLGPREGFQKWFNSSARFKAKN